MRKYGIVMQEVKSTYHSKRSIQNILKSDLLKNERKYRIEIFAMSMEN